MKPIDIGMQVARAEFKRRGNHTEVHLSEAELAALISIGAERAFEQRASESCAGGHPTGLVHRKVYDQVSQDLGQAKAKIAEIEAKLQTAAPE